MDANTRENPEFRDAVDEDVSGVVSFGSEIFEISTGVEISIGNGDVFGEFLEFFLDIRRE